MLVFQLKYTSPILDSESSNSSILVLGTVLRHRLDMGRYIENNAIYRRCRKWTWNEIL